MRKPIAISAALFFFSVTLVASTQSQTSRTRIFRSAEVITATGVAIPFNSVANGIVELYLTIGVAGNVEDVRVARLLASVTDQSVRAVKTWTFEPATMRGKPIESRLTVVVVFCPPYGYGAGEITLPPISSESQKQPSDSAQPSASPEIVFAKYPTEGGGRVYEGPAVLRVLVGADGQPGLVRVVHGKTPLVDEARLAIKDWKFSPAQVNDKDVISGIVLAFQFRSTITNQ
jgi:outer membrane biosynthesis protein TonB